MQTGQFKLHMDGLLEVLAGSLYANPVVGLRELIQNGHDSCTRYRIESGSAASPRIDIVTNEADGTLTVSDSGAGLTADEIDAYLTTIGRSYTRQLRGDLALFELEKSKELIGQFGFGFLSAFMLASEVALETYSFRDGAEPIRWTSDGGNGYELSAGSRSSHGTTVRLKLRAEAVYLLDEDVLEQKVRQFASFLPVPIYVNGDSEPVNDGIPPWDALDPAQAIGQFIKRQFPGDEPLAVLQLSDYEVQLDGGDSAEIPLSGFLFIPPSTTASVREFGDLQVYIRRMFITDDERELLPGWAKFVRGVIDSPYLHPTASRETVRRDENFTLVRDALAAQLGDFLNNIQHEQPRIWRRIVNGHSSIMTGWAVRDDAFFHEIADILTFRTSQGRMTLPDYLALTDGRIYTVTREIKSLQEKVLAEGNAAPVIEAVWFAVRPFLEKYVEVNGLLPVVALDENTTHLLQSVSRRDYSELLAACERLDISADVAKFEPADIPALMIYPQESEFWHETQEALDNNEIDPALAGLIEGYMVEVDTAERTAGTLTFNAANSFVQSLNSLPSAQQEMAVSLLYQVARLFSGKTMTASSATAAFASLTDTMSDLLT